MNDGTRALYDLLFGVGDFWNGFHRRSQPRILRSSLLAMLEAGCRGRLARRNVNTGRPISLIGPIRSNAHHSPVHIARRKARRLLYAPGSGHCSRRYVCFQYARMYPCTCTLMLPIGAGMRWKHRHRPKRVSLLILRMRQCVQVRLQAAWHFCCTVCRKVISRINNYCNEAVENIVNE